MIDCMRGSHGYKMRAGPELKWVKVSDRCIARTCDFRQQPAQHSPSAFSGLSAVAALLPPVISGHDKMGYGDNRGYFSRIVELLRGFLSRLRCLGGSTGQTEAEMGP
jgi:hypothetical protein